MLTRERTDADQRLEGSSMDDTEINDTEITEPDDADRDQDEEQVVWQWRAQQLHRLGLSSLLAHTFAAVVDWHEFARLVDRGCSPELALEIVR
jgi:hypothetical protein